MGTENSYRGLEEYAVKLIQIKARQLAGKAGFALTDREDLEQEIAIDLLRRLPNFKPSRSRRKTFISRIVEHKVCSLLAAQTAECRDYRLRSTSLHDEVLDMDGRRVERWQGLDEAKYLRKSPRKAAEVMDLRIDLAEAIRSLPPALVRLCRDLRKATTTEVSVTRGIPRSTIYNAIKKIRARLEAAGVAGYWGKARRNGSPAGRDETEASERPTSSDVPEGRPEGTSAAEVPVKRDVYRYAFAPGRSIDEIADQLLIAVYAAEALHGRAEVGPNGVFSLDEGGRSCVVDATTRAGESLVQIFTDSLTREFGHDAFSVERVLADEPAAVAAEVRS